MSHWADDRARATGRDSNAQRSNVPVSVTSMRAPRFSETPSRVTGAASRQPFSRPLGCSATCVEPLNSRANDPDRHETPSMVALHADRLHYALASWAVS